MLRERLQPRGDPGRRHAARRARGREGTVVEIFDECKSGRSRACPIRPDRIIRNAICIETLAAIPVRGIESRNDRAEVGSIQEVGAVIPVLATEGTDGDIQLHNVEELAVTPEDLHPAIFEDVPGSADAWGNLVSPTESNRIALEPGGTAAGQIFLVKPNTCIDCDAVADGPSVLGEQAVIKAGHVSASSEI